MLWNPYQYQTRSYKIVEAPTIFYGILEKNALKSISVANKMLQDSTGYLTKMLWKPYQ